MGEQRRLRRWEWLAGTFPDIGRMSVIDLGGTAESWGRAPVRPGCVHVVNLEPEPADLPSWVRATQGDACDLPAAIRASSYDLVFSNSVLEHVGGWAQRQRMADAIHGLAARHWVQTPNRWFPVEPHWICPCLQFLPLGIRGRTAQWWPLSHTREPGRTEGLRAALEVELITRTEMRLLFPSSEIRAERLAGLAKSLIAVRPG